MQDHESTSSCWSSTVQIVILLKIHYITEMNKYINKQMVSEQNITYFSFRIRII